MYVRVKDKTTKHQFDVPEGDPRIGTAFELLDSARYPRARSPRPPKHHVPVKSARATEQGPSDTSPASDSQTEAPAEAAETPESKPARANSRK